MKINSRGSFVSTALLAGQWSDTIDLILKTKDNKVKFNRCRVLLEHLESIKFDDTALVRNILLFFSQLDQSTQEGKDFLSSVIFRVYKLSKISSQALFVKEFFEDFLIMLGICSESQLASLMQSIEAEMISAPVPIERLRLLACQSQDIKDVGHALSLLNQEARQNKRLDKTAWSVLEFRVISKKAPVKLIAGSLFALVKELSTADSSFLTCESDVELIIQLLLCMLKKSRDNESKKTQYIFEKSLKTAAWLLSTERKEFKEIGKAFYLTLWAKKSYSYQGISFFMDSYRGHAVEFPELEMYFENAIMSLCSSEPLSLTHSAFGLYNCVKFLESTRKQHVTELDRRKNHLDSLLLLNYCFALYPELIVHMICDFWLPDILVKQVIICISENEKTIGTLVKKAIRSYLCNAHSLVKARKRAALLISAAKEEKDKNFRVRLALMLLSDSDDTVIKEAVSSVTSSFAVGEIPESISKAIEDVLRKSDNSLLNEEIMRFAQVHYT
jgi:hypothetical protein